MSEKLLFLDTNIFLHYRSFDQIDWPTLVEASAVTIVIPPVTFRELNKHKDGHNASHIRKRAGDVQKKLNRLFSDKAETELNAKVRIRIEPDDPAVRDLDPHLQSEIQDDQLIASILLARQKYPELGIILVAADEGLLLRIKASKYGISYYSPDDKYRLQEQRDPNEQRVRELEKENAELRRRIPDIKLAFEDGKSHATFSLMPPVEMTDEIITHKLDELKAAYPLMPGKILGTSETHNNSYQQFERTLAQLAAAMSSSTIQQEDIDEYNKELEQFYRQYADFFTADTRFTNLLRRTLPLNIHLLNEGTVPAEDIEVFLHFPDGFELFGEDELPDVPEKPAPPRKPRTAMQKMQEQISFMAHRDILIPPIYNSHLSTPRLNVSAPSIQKTNSYDVDIHVDRAKHHLSEPFNPLFVVFDSYDEAKSFEIEYSLHAANVPKPVEGTLHIVVKKEVKP
jgi:hypothetical protein